MNRVKLNTTEVTNNTVTMKMKCQELFMKNYDCHLDVSKRTLHIFLLFHKFIAIYRLTKV